jgi:hypothetical protein
MFSWRQCLAGVFAPRRRSTKPLAGRQRHNSPVVQRASTVDRELQVKKRFTYGKL